MTETEKKYNVLMQELATLLQKKNDEISMLKWRVADLEAKLKEAENSEVKEHAE